MKRVIRVNEKELRKAAIDHNLKSNEELARKIGISTSQLWRCTLPPDDSRYNAPGPAFMAGVLNAFGGPIDRFFFLDQDFAFAKDNNEREEVE